jgi:hypothetical protein
MLVSPSQVTGALAMWAVRQSPYPVPDNLEIAVASFEHLFPRDEIGFHEVASEQELYELVKKISEQIPELLAWNERKNGNDAPLGFCGRYDRPEPDNDFIDLYALWGNVARTVANEERVSA